MKKETIGTPLKATVGMHLRSCFCPKLFHRLLLSSVLTAECRVFARCIYIPDMVRGLGIREGGLDKGEFRKNWPEVACDWQEKHLTERYCHAYRDAREAAFLIFQAPSFKNWDAMREQTVSAIIIILNF